MRKGLGLSTPIGAGAGGNGGRVISVAGGAPGIAT